MRLYAAPPPGPASMRPAPLTEDDDEPHDKGQGSKDQASIADGLVV